MPNFINLFFSLSNNLTLTSLTSLTLPANIQILARLDIDETLTCLAEWKDDRDKGQTFLIGTIDTRYRRTIEQRLRCFLLRKERPLYFSTKLHS